MATGTSPSTSVSSASTSQSKGTTLNNSITLEKPWYHRHLGMTYPAGTVFIRLLDNPRVWSYTTPDGGSGQTLLGKVIPGLLPLDISLTR